MIRKFCVALTLLDALAVGNTRADLIIGGMFSPTGPNATIGLTDKNATELMPRNISGQPVKYVILEDAVDPSLGSDSPRLRDRNARCG
jgi:branched-chain amino acid transport system substrate-binding protein